MSDTQFDLAIIGGGPTGSALAIMLGKLAPDPARIALLQSDQASRYGISQARDARVIAINEGTRILLNDLEAWPNDVAPIHTIHVSQRGRLGRTLITHEQFKVAALGYVVSYASVHETLLRAAQGQGITLIQDKAQEVANTSDQVRVEGLSHQFSARLVVRADGMNHQQTPDRYRQVALIGQAKVSQPRPGWAYERFTREGPLAVLPHPAGDGSQSIVWCCDPAHAQELQALGQTEFSKAMTVAFGRRLGDFVAQSSFQAYPLYQSLDPQPVEGRIVNIGNAAQTLHPVAGQGLNLGLRDAATLSHCLRDWIAQVQRDPSRPLSIYENLRRPDRMNTARLTDFMSRIFTTGWPAVEHAAGLSLLALDTCASLRAPLARHLMQGLRL